MAGSSSDGGGAASNSVVKLEKVVAIVDPNTNAEYKVIDTNMKKLRIEQVKLVEQMQKIREVQSTKGKGKFMVHHNKNKCSPSLVFAPW